MPEISVIMPAHNAQAYVAEALASVLRALPRDAELVVLDDGSTDGTRAVVEGHLDRRVRVLSHPTGRGVAAGLQRLLDETDSRYVARMDADDITLPGRLQWQRHHVTSGACDISFTAVVRFGGGRRLRPGLPVPISADAMPLHLAVHNPLCHPTMFARREALTGAGGYRQVGAEDHDLWLRAVSQGFRLARTAAPLLAYRVHPGQVSGQHRWATRALSEPAFRSTYGEFAEAVLGRPAVWLEALWPADGESPSDEAVRGLAVLAQEVGERARSLPPTQRAVLRRTTRHLERRIEDLGAA